MDVKLQECSPNLPMKLFPNYRNARKYCEIFRHPKSGKIASRDEKCAYANKKACCLKKSKLNHPHENVDGK